MESRIHRSLRHLDYVARDLLQPLCDGVAMHRAECGHLEDEQVEGALREIGFDVVRHTMYFYILSRYV